MTSQNRDDVTLKGCIQQLFAVFAAMVIPIEALVILFYFVPADWVASRTVSQFLVAIPYLLVFYFFNAIEARHWISWGILLTVWMFYLYPGFGELAVSLIGVNS